mmetsp:Transcript_10666/g.32651  ORF Transcript_10666/g.32651 Transcript_10666/m.32651 type:complete len:217 (+) Transcript_10666:3034-3684(+)
MSATRSSNLSVDMEMPLRSSSSCTEARSTAVPSAARNESPGRRECRRTISTIDPDSLSILVRTRSTQTRRQAYRCSCSQLSFQIVSESSSLGSLTTTVWKLLSLTTSEPMLSAEASASLFLFSPIVSSCFSPDFTTEMILSTMRVFNVFFRDSMLRIPLNSCLEVTFPWRRKRSVTLRDSSSKSSATITEYRGYLHRCSMAASSGKILPSGPLLAM